MNTNGVKSVMIVGVGGQGTLLASRILGNAMLEKGFDVKVSEVHGMSQRGGSVVTYVRYGESVESPVIETGEADIVLAFEQLEAARFLPYLKEGGVMVVNTQRIDPMPVIAGGAEYPQGLIEGMRALGIKLLELDALKLAEESGSARAVNVVLIGAMAEILDFDKGVWIKALESSVPEKFLELNKRAFELGYDAGRRNLKNNCRI